MFIQYRLLIRRSFTKAGQTFCFTGIKVMKEKELLKYLTDSSNHILFYSDDINNYIEFHDFISNLESAFSKNNYSNEIEKKFIILLKQLDFIDNETTLKQNYYEGITIYLDKNNKEIKDPQNYFRDYLLNSNEWIKIIKIAKEIENLL